MESIRVRRAWLVGAFVVSSTRMAVAGAPEEREARRVYDEGVESYAAGRFDAAAVQFSRADELAANDVALDQALRSAIKAELPALAMRLADRTEGRKGSTLFGLAKVARSRFANSVGEILFQCPERAKCRAVVDGETILDPGRLWVARGKHSVTWVVNDNESKQDLAVEAGALVRVGNSINAKTNDSATTKKDALPRANDATKREADSGGVSPAFFWIALGITGVAGAATVASGLDVLSKNRAYETNPAPERLAEGHDAESRTNILIGVTSALGVTTVALAFIVRWRPAPSGPQVAVTPRGIAVAGEF